MFKTRKGFFKEFFQTQQIFFCAELSKLMNQAKYDDP